MISGSKVLAKATVLITVEVPALYVSVWDRALRDRLVGFDWLQPI